MTTPSQSAHELLLAREYVHQWTFSPSPVPRWRRGQVLEAVLRRSVRAPASRVIKAAPTNGNMKWALYFAYLPLGGLSKSHEFTLRRLREQSFSICVVAAVDDWSKVPASLHELADAIVWKGLAGYDFSAYKIGLDLLSRIAEGASVLVMNDSVAGPLVDLNPFMDALPWDLNGFSATGKIENHIQSYAFVLKGLSRRRVRALRTVLFPWFACAARDDVIACQETRLARVAAESMDVGSLWYSATSDVTQAAPFELLDAGFPFLKHSLATERSAFADKARVISFISALENNTTQDIPHA